MANVNLRPHSTEKSETREVDMLDKLLSDTGCADLHYKVQECIAESKDWRKCQTEVRAFRDCINKNKEKKMEDGKF